MSRSRSMLDTAARIAMLGFAGGLRSQTPLAALSVSVWRHGAGASVGFIGRPIVAIGLCMSALGEVLVDKLPVTPSRIRPGPLGGRIMFGAIAGGLLSRRMSAPVISGTILGAAGAIAGSYAGYHVRASLTRSTDVPVVVWAGFEDVVALSLSLLATKD